MKVVLFHFTDAGRLPPLSQEELKALSDKFAEELKNYPDVKFNGAFVNEKGKGICDWEAPNAEVVEKIVTRVIGSPPADGAIAVKKVL